MAKINIEGKDYKVVENMGFNHDIGGYAKFVQTDEGEKVAVKFRGGQWKFWRPQDKLRRRGPITGQAPSA